MLEINFKKLLRNYDQNLLDNLRGFGKDDEYLKFWVPGTNEYQSFLNLIDALVESKIFEVQILFDNELKSLATIEDFLKNISEKDKEINKELIIFKIKINLEKYNRFRKKKLNENKKTETNKIDTTKRVKIFSITDFINPIYKDNLYKIKPKSFFSENKIENKNIYYSDLDNFFVGIHVENKIIINLVHNVKDDSDLKKILDIFFEIILNKNIQEAADHGTIYLEEKIRNVDTNIKSEGIILPGQAGLCFNILNKIIREVYIEYKSKNNLEFDVNRNYFNTSEKWINLSENDKIKKINLVITNICENHKLDGQKSISVNKIENNFKVYLNVSETFKKVQEKKNLLLQLETDLKNLDNTLEVFIDEILDQNKLRLKNSPQNLQ